MVAIFMVQCPGPDQWAARDLFLKTATQVFSRVHAGNKAGGRVWPWLVICLHGFGEWPAHLMRLSHWNRLADESGSLVVYPSGSGFPLHWFCNGKLNRADQAQRDVQFISDLIDQLKRSHNIDTARI